MSVTNIATATRHLEELLHVLDDAYWEAATVERKDAFYATISVLNGELAELAKLSIQDHGLLYQPITSEFRDLKPRLNHLHKLNEDASLRPSTALRLEASIPPVVALIS